MAGYRRQHLIDFGNSFLAIFCNNFILFTNSWMKRGASKLRWAGEGGAQRHVCVNE
jgi:hypothetical protein